MLSSLDDIPTFSHFVSGCSRISQVAYVQQNRWLSNLQRQNLAIQWASFLFNFLGFVDNSVPFWLHTGFNQSIYSLAAPSCGESSRSRCRRCWSEGHVFTICSACHSDAWPFSLAAIRRSLTHSNGSCQITKLNPFFVQTFCHLIFVQSWCYSLSSDSLKIVWIFPKIIQNHYPPSLRMDD